MMNNSILQVVTQSNKALIHRYMSSFVSSSPSSFLLSSSSSSSSSLLTPIIFTIGSCRRCWMNGPIPSMYYNQYHTTAYMREYSIGVYNKFKSLCVPHNIINNNSLLPPYSNYNAMISNHTQQQPYQQHHQQRRSTVHLIPQIHRIHKNMARLYARRILELAMMSAAIQKYKSQLIQQTQLESISSLQQHHHHQQQPSRPSDWENWSRQEFQNELLNAIGNNTITRLWSATQRIVSLSCLLVPFTILYPLSYISDTINTMTWSYALWSIEQAGPTFIKLFQWATTRQDLFSSQFCQHFSQLQDHTKGHPWKDTLSILHHDLLLLQQLHEQADSTSSVPITATKAKAITHQKHPQQNTTSSSQYYHVNEYISLDPKPIGSGCIAQVYRGTLLQSIGQYNKGTEIAIKVQHPGIVHKVCIDFYIMNYMAYILESIPYLNLSFLSLVDSVHKFRDIMIPQLDLSIEAKHLQRFNRDFVNDPYVSFPKPINELTSSRILTETYIHGTPILHYVSASDAERKELALLGLNTTLKMIFLNDFLHGDLHPGNILVSRDTSTTSASGHHPLQLHLLDCGLVVEMGPEQHVNLVKILGAFARRNGRLAGQLMVDTSSNCQASAIDIELFVKGIEHIVVDDENNNFLEKVGDYITDICYLACQKKVKLEASFINAALAVEIMEGIATALYPDLKVTQVALPLVVQAELMHRLPKLSIW